MQNGIGIIAVFERLQSIVSDGMINTADTWVSRKVKRVVWFSTNTCWEKTVVKIGDQRACTNC